MEVEDSFLENLCSGCFVAIFLYKYDKMPVLEKYYLLGNLYFLIHYWKGSYCEKKNIIFHKEDQNLGFRICQNLAWFVVIYTSQKITD